VGESYEILGMQAEFAREWQAFGVERLPGFSRASFTAANQIAIGGSLLLAGRLGACDGSGSSGSCRSRRSR
jgi:hypothetical protein